VSIPDLREIVSPLARARCLAKIIDEIVRVRAADSSKGRNLCPAFVISLQGIFAQISPLRLLFTETLADRKRAHFRETSRSGIALDARAHAR